MAPPIAQAMAELFKSYEEELHAERQKMNEHAARVKDLEEQLSMYRGANNVSLISLTPLHRMY